MILPTMRWLYSNSIIPGNALFNRTITTTNTAKRKAVIIKESHPPVPDVCEMTFGMLMTVYAVSVSSSRKNIWRFETLLCNGYPSFHI